MDVIVTVAQTAASISSVSESRLLLACLNRLTFGPRIALTSLETI